MSNIAPKTAMALLQRNQKAQQTPAGIHLLINQMRRAKGAGNKQEIELLRREFDVELDKQTTALTKKHNTELRKAVQARDEAQKQVDSLKSKKELEAELQELTSKTE